MDICTAEFRVPDLKTKSVTFTPTNATIVREIPVSIQPGQNAITISGLDPRVDFDSIRVDGSGAATITNIQAETVPRVEEFKEGLRESDREGNSDANSDCGVDDSELQDAARLLTQTQAEVAKARNDCAAVVSSLQILGNYGESFDAKDVEVAKVAEFLKLYRRQQEEGGEIQARAAVEIARKEKEIEKLTTRISRLENAFNKKKAAALKEVTTEKQKKEQQLEQKKKQRQRDAVEKWKFWTPSVAQVTVHLDGYEDTADSPRSRNTVLRIRYVVPMASWTSRYEVSVNTPAEEVKIAYRAEFLNSSIETWRDAEVVFSTLQTSFTRLEEKIPSLQPWRVKLGSKNDAPTNWQNVLKSKDEMDGLWQGNKVVSPGRSPGRRRGFPHEQKSMFHPGPGQQSIFDRRKAQDTSKLSFFKKPSAPAPFEGFGHPVSFGKTFDLPLFGQTQAPSKPLFGQSNQNQGTQSSFFGNIKESPSTGQGSGGLFGKKAQTEGLSPFAANSQETPDKKQFPTSPNQFQAQTAFENASSTLFGNIPRPQLTPFTTPPTIAVPSPAPPSPTPQPTPMEYRETNTAKIGLTTTHTLPNALTIVPTTTPRRHFLSTLPLSCALSYIIVPKHREAAFLSAKIKNTSEIAILHGKSGITVDNTFLGSSTLGPCPPNQEIELSLGIDPSIHVTYHPPTVKRTSGGLFNKDDTALFKRLCTVKNSKPVPINILLLDQIPVPDEGVGIKILEPVGLAMEGDMVASEGGVVGLNRNGEVKRDVRVRAGEEKRFLLTYEGRVMFGDEVEVA